MPQPDALHAHPTPQIVNAVVGVPLSATVARVVRAVGELGSAPSAEALLTAVQAVARVQTECGVTLAALVPWSRAARRTAGAEAIRP